MFHFFLLVQDFLLWWGFKNLRPLFNGFLCMKNWLEVPFLHHMRTPNMFCSSFWLLDLMRHEIFMKLKLLNETFYCSSSFTFSLNTEHLVLWMKYTLFMNSDQTNAFNFSSGVYQENIYFIFSFPFFIFVCVFD